MQIIDTHAHIYDLKFKNDLDEILRRSIDNNISKIICVGVDLESSYECVNLAEKNKQIYATVGIHPHESNKAPKNYLYELEQFCDLPKVVAIGESGLDFHYNFSAPKIQIKSFMEHLEFSKSKNLPIVVHTRNSDEKVSDCILESKMHNGVIHSFSSNLEFAKKVIKMGFKISFSGMITFIKHLEEVVEKINLDDILIETDSPYLSPIPNRGKRNEPANIVEVLKKISEIKDIDLNLLSSHFYKNSLALFKKLDNT